MHFIKNVDYNSSTGDLYIYDGKDNTKVVKNIGLYNSGIVFDSGSMVFANDNGKFILYNAAGDEIVKLGSIDSVWNDINYISDKKVIYVADEKLCYYNGKETFKIASRVEYVSFASTSGYTLSNSSYNYVDR